MNLAYWFLPFSEGFSLRFPVFHPPQKPTLQIYSNLTRREDLHANQLFKTDVASSTNIVNVLVNMIKYVSFLLSSSGELQQ